MWFLSCLTSACKHLYDDNLLIFYAETMMFLLYSSLITSLDDETCRVLPIFAIIKTISHRKKTLNMTIHSVRININFLYIAHYTVDFGFYFCNFAIWNITVFRGLQSLIFFQKLLALLYVKILFNLNLYFSLFCSEISFVSFFLAINFLFHC